MKTTIDLPDQLLERTKLAAARRRTTVEDLIVEGLNRILGVEAPTATPTEAIARLRQGYHLGGLPLNKFLGPGKICTDVQDIRKI